MQQVEQVITEETRTRHVEAPPQEKNAYQKKKAIFRTFQIVWYIVGVIEVLLIFRVFLKILGANPASGFVNFIYGVSLPFTAPFSGMFGTTISGTSVVEWSTFVAMIVYIIVAYLLIKLFQIVKPTTPEEVEQGVSQ